MSPRPSLVCSLADAINVSKSLSVRLIRSFRLWLYFLKRDAFEHRGVEQCQLFFCGLQLWPSRVPNAAAFGLRALHHKTDDDTSLNAKHIAFGSRQSGIRAHVAAKIHDVNVVEFFSHDLAEPIKGPAFDEVAITNDVTMPFSSTRSEAQRKNRASMS
jgi:hypothetical protein